MKSVGKSRVSSTSTLNPSLLDFAGVVSAPSSPPLDVTETLLFRGGIVLV